MAIRTSPPMIVVDLPNLIPISFPILSPVIEKSNVVKPIIIAGKIIFQPNNAKLIPIISASILVAIDCAIIARKFNATL